MRRLHTEAIAKENWTPIAPRYIIQIYSYVANSFYGTQCAESDIHHIVCDHLHGGNALPLVHNEFAFMDAVGPVFVLCNAPLSLEQSHCKQFPQTASAGTLLGDLCKTNIKITVVLPYPMKMESYLSLFLD